MFSSISKIRSGSNQPDVLPFTGFHHGLNTSAPADRIAITECSELINWKIKKNGSLENRSPITKFTGGATTSNSGVSCIQEVNLSGTVYTLLTDDNHVLYYLDNDNNPVEIGTLEGESTIMSFNGVAMLFDGSYIKYLDGVTEIKIAYDAGSGLRAVQVDKTAETQDTTVLLGDGTNERVAQKFTSQAWDSGYTIPPIKLTVYLKKIGSPTGNINMVLRAVSDDSVLATKVFYACADVGTSAAAIYYNSFTSTDITTEMSPSIAYYISLEYDNGDVSNYIEVQATTVTSGGGAYYYDTSWHNSSTKDCVLSLSPGRPPKGSFGEIWNNRPWVSDPDNPGQLWYGNLTHLDWSTADGGGYIGVVDGDSNNFPVGAISAFYGNLYAFGKQNQPYLVKISGSTPSDYTQETAFQKPWATHKTLVSSTNDLWYSGADGVSPLSGVQEYGDLRTFYASDPVIDRIEDYWSTPTAIAGYYPFDGEYWLVMPLYHRVMVCRTKNPVMNPSGSGTRYPWTEYEFYRDDFTSSDYQWVANGGEWYLQAAAGGTPGLIVQPDALTLDGKAIIEGTAGNLEDHQWDYTLDPTSTYYTVYFKDTDGSPTTSGVDLRSVLIPTCFSQIGDDFLIGGSDGFIYKLDPSEYKDIETIQTKPRLKTAYIETPFTHANFSELHLLASSRGGGMVRINFYTDSYFGSVSATSTILMPFRDNLTVDDAIMDVDDAVFLVDVETKPLFEYCNFNARSVMVEMDNVMIAGYPIVLNGVILKYRRLGH